MKNTEDQTPHFVLNWRNIAQLRDWLDAAAQNDHMYFDVYVTPPIDEEVKDPKTGKHIDYTEPAQLHFALCAWTPEESGNVSASYLAFLDYEPTKEDESGEVWPPDVDEFLAKGGK